MTLDVGRWTSEGGSIAVALERREDAREGHRRLVGLARAATGTPAAEQADDLRDASQARVVASEAWVGWLEHGV